MRSSTNRGRPSTSDDDSVTDYITTLILERRRLLPVLVVLLTVAASFPAARIHFDNSIELWFSEGDPELAVYDQFAKQYQADQIVVIGVFDDDVFDKDTLSVIDRISTAAAELEHAFRVSSITSSVFAARLEGGFLDSNFRESVMDSPVLNGLLVSPDGTAAAIVVYLSRAGESAKLKSRFVVALDDIAVRETRNTAASFVLAGAPVMGKAGQAKNQRDMRILVPIMVVVILLLSFAVLRNVWLSFLPLTVVVIAVIWSFAFMGIAGWQMTMVSAMLMPLILAVGVADTIHVVVHFRRQLSPAGVGRKPATSGQVESPETVAALLFYDHNDDGRITGPPGQCYCSGKAVRCCRSRRCLCGIRGEHHSGSGMPSHNPGIGRGKVDWGKRCTR